MSESRIPLSEMVAELRRELIAAKLEGKDSDLRFQVEETEIELQVVVEREAGAGTSVKFWVFNADAKGKLKDAITQKIKLKLKPSNQDGSDFNMGATE